MFVAELESHKKRITKDILNKPLAVYLRGFNVSSFLSDIQSMAFFMQKIMDKKQILHGNKLIAMFVGKEINGVPVNLETSNLFIRHLKYHSDWNELMFVVEYLEDLSVFVDIGVCECFIYVKIKGVKKIISGCTSDESKIDATYKAILKFVEDYIKNL
jgi:hypothetical protein